MRLAVTTDSSDRNSEFRVLSAYNLPALTTRPSLSRASPNLGHISGAAGTSRFRPLHALRSVASGSALENERNTRTICRVFYLITGDEGIKNVYTLDYDPLTDC